MIKKKKIKPESKGKTVYTKFSLIPPMAGGRESDVSWVSAKKKKLNEGSVESNSEVAWHKYPLQVHVWRNVQESLLPKGMLLK